MRGRLAAARASRSPFPTTSTRSSVSDLPAFPTAQRSRSGRLGAPRADSRTHRGCRSRAGQDHRARGGESTAGVLEVDGDRVRFAHPLLARSLCERDAARRRALHARLAEVWTIRMSAPGTSRSPPPVPTHAVAAAVTRPLPAGRGPAGHPEAAATLWEQARRLTPASDSEARRGGRSRPENAIRGGETPSARGRCSRSRRRLRPRTRSRDRDHPARVGRAFREGLSRRRGAVSRRHSPRSGTTFRPRIEIERGLAWSLHEIRRCPRGRSPRARRRSSSRSKAGVPRCSPVLSRTWRSSRRSGDGESRSRSIERALELETDDEWRSMLGRSDRPGSRGCCSAGPAISTVPGATLEGLRSSVVARGDDHSLTYVSFHLGRVECLAGNWELAARYADECFEIMAQTGQEEERPSP